MAQIEITTKTVPRKILIEGLPKTGTTALFFNLLDTLSPNAHGLFEPKDHSELYTQRKFTDEQLRRITIVAKVLCVRHDQEQYNIFRLPNVNFSSFADYEKKIFIIRDPRDTLISFMLYMIVNSTKLIQPVNAIEFISLLVKKEENPKSISVLDIFDLMNRLNECDFIRLIQEWHEFSIDHLKASGEYFIVKYEDYIMGVRRGLESYLGFPLNEKVEVHKNLSRVVRTKGSGDWKNWFLEEDIAYFQPMVLGYMDRYGYEPDWTIAEEPMIRPEHGSDYVKRIVNELYRSNWDGPNPPQL